MATAVVTTACSSFSDEAPDPGDAAMVTETSTSDGSTSEEGAAIADAPTVDGSILVAEFDEATPACLVGWQPIAASANVVPDAGRNGTGACRICRLGGSLFTFAQSAKLPASPGSTFYFEAWLRDEAADPDGGVPSGGPRLEEKRAEASDNATSVTVALTSEFRQYQTTLTALENAGVRVELRFTSNVDNDCVLVDRLLIVQTR